jgi:hypothetical protein
MDRFSLTRTALLAAALAALAGCAAVRTTDARKPLAHPPGKALEVEVLGAQYTFPSRLDIEDHEDAPGHFTVVYTDHLTRCEGFVMFETIGTASLHDNYVRQKVASLRDGFSSAQIQVVERRRPVQLLGREASATVLDLTNQGDQAAAGLLAHHFQDQNLSVVGYTFCDDSNLLETQLQALAAVVNSQKRT